MLVATGTGSGSVEGVADSVADVVVGGGVETVVAVAVAVVVAVVVAGAAAFVSPSSEQPVTNRTIDISPTAAIAFITFAFTTKPRRPRLEYLLVRAPSHRRAKPGHYSGAGR